MVFRFEPNNYGGFGGFPSNNGPPIQNARTSFGFRLPTSNDNARGRREDDNSADRVVMPSFNFLRPMNNGTCTICYCEYSTEDGVQLQSCLHLFCEECFTQYVQTKARDGEVDEVQMSCPYLCDQKAKKKCGKSLNQQDVLACLQSEADRDRYLRLNLGRFVDTMENMGCCPTPGCNFQFEWDPQNYKLVCPLCSQSYCMVCKTGWHSGIPCEEFQEQQKWSKDDQQFQAFAQANSLKQCPKCKFWVEKKSGCNSMHCRCNLVFCYECGGCLKGTAQANGFKECLCQSSIAHMQSDEGTQSRNLRGEGHMPAFGFDHPPGVRLGEYIENLRRTREELFETLNNQRTEILGRSPGQSLFGQRRSGTNGPPPPGPFVVATASVAVGFGPPSSFSSNQNSSRAASFGASTFRPDPPAFSFETRPSSGASIGNQAPRTFGAPTSTTVSAAEPRSAGSGSAFTSGMVLQSAAVPPFSFGHGVAIPRNAAASAFPPTGTPSLGFSFSVSAPHGQGAFVAPSPAPSFSFGSNGHNAMDRPSAVSPAPTFGFGAPQGSSQQTVSHPPSQTSPPLFGVTPFPSWSSNVVQAGSQVPDAPVFASYPPPPSVSFGRHQDTIQRRRSRGRR